MKTLAIELPPKNGEGAHEATLIFQGHGDSAPWLNGGQQFALKLRLDHQSTYVYFYARSEPYSWSGPNQSPFGVIVHDDPHSERPHATVIDSILITELVHTRTPTVNRYVIKFPDQFNWIQVGDLAVPIP